MEAVKNKDLAACRQLQLMFGLMDIQKSQQMLVSFAKIYASDAALLRGLVEEAPAPVTLSFAKVVLEACTALKDVDLAAEVFEKAAESDTAALRSIVEKAATTPPSSEMLCSK